MTIGNTEGRRRRRRRRRRRPKGRASSECG